MDEQTAGGLDGVMVSFDTLIQQGGEGRRLGYGAV
jgi:hypothetical protein